MQSVTPEDKASLLTSPTRLFRVEIEEPDGTIAASTDEGFGQRLHLAAGTVSANGNGDIQRTARLTFEDDAGLLRPYVANDLLHPLSGRQIRIWAGIRRWARASADAELIATDRMWRLGVFFPMAVETNRDRDKVTLSVECDDRGSRIRDNAWPQARYHARCNYEARMTWIIEQAYQNSLYRWSPADVLVPNKWYGIDGRNDRWADMKATARRAAKTLIVNSGGTFTTLTVPDPEETDPVWTFSTHQDHNLATIGRTLDRRDTYNVVILDVESPERPESGEVRNFRVYEKDDNPESPTYIGGPLGRRTLRERATKPMSLVNAQAAVTARYKALRRTTESVSLSSLMTPALEVFDVVQIEDDWTGTTAPHLLESFNIDLLSGVMSAQTQSRRIRNVHVGPRPILRVIPPVPTGTPPPVGPPPPLLPLMTSTILETSTLLETRG